MWYQLLALFLLVGCTQAQVDELEPVVQSDSSETPAPDTLVEEVYEPFIISEPDTNRLRSYSGTLVGIKGIKESFYDQYDHDPYWESAQSASRAKIMDFLSNDIWPAWYGTPWDYNGYTNTPNDGIIACGYFVSTTLKHCGFNMNRYDVAKSYSKNIVEILTDSSTQVIFPDIHSLLEHIEQRPDDIYIVGLSNHVGFLIKENGRIDFVHSNYGFPMMVIREEAYYSEALNWSQEYWLGSLLYSEGTITKWILDDKFAVN